MKKWALMLTALTAIMSAGIPVFAGIEGAKSDERAINARALGFGEIGSRRTILRPQVTAAADSLDEAVIKAAITAKEKQVAASYGTLTQPVVELHRTSTDGNWAFGGVYFPIPFGVMDVAPVTTLFVAYQVAGDGWTVALRDSEKFQDMVLQAPKEVVSNRERQLFAARSANLFNLQNMLSLQQDVGLSLPFERNGAVWGHSGVHGNGGNTRPFNSIDFWGGDGRVLASRGGIAYKFCTNSTTSRWPYVEVVHDNGWTTGYYHTKNQSSIVSGQQINEGDFIGMIAMELPCGGGATGDHVHWTLWRGDQNGAAEAVDNKTIGGWTWHEGIKFYSGYAERYGARVDTDRSGLVNYGYGDASQSVVDNAVVGRFAASGNWGISTYSAERYATNYAYAQPLPVSDAAWFKFLIPESGSYEVFVWYPSNSGYNSATPFVIATTAGNRVVRVNQQINGGRWTSLGVHPLAGGDYNVVGVSRWTNSPGYVIADAVQLVRR